MVSRGPRDLAFLLTRLQGSSQSYSRPQLTPSVARRAQPSVFLLRRPNAILHRIGGVRRCLRRADVRIHTGYPAPARTDVPCRYPSATVAEGAAQVI